MPTPSPISDTPISSRNERIARDKLELLTERPVSFAPGPAIPNRVIRGGQSRGQGISRHLPLSWGLAAGTLRAAWAFAASLASHCGRPRLTHYETKTAFSADWARGVAQVINPPAMAPLVGPAWATIPTCMTPVNPSGAVSMPQDRDRTHYPRGTPG